MLRAAVEEAAQGRVEFRLVEEERVVALVGLDLDETHVRRDRVKPCTMARLSLVG